MGLREATFESNEFVMASVRAAAARAGRRVVDEALAVDAGVDDAQWLVVVVTACELELVECDAADAEPVPGSNRAGQLSRAPAAAPAAEPAGTSRT